MRPKSSEGNFREAVTECLIKGVRTRYDACGSNSLEECKKIYKDFEYIQSGQVRYIDGIKYKSKILYHFFQRKTTKPKSVKEKASQDEESDKRYIIFLEE